MSHYFMVTIFIESQMLVVTFFDMFYFNRAYLKIAAITTADITYMLPPAVERFHEGKLALKKLQYKIQL